MADIKVPLEFLLEIEDLINSINLDKFDGVTKMRFESVLDIKRKKLANRETFKNMKYAKGEEKQDLIIEYLQNKNDIKRGSSPTKVLLYPITIRVFKTLPKAFLLYHILLN